MIEIAISLAIIGIALISIIGILPIGMNTQRDNREETLINQDATILMEAIRSGAKGMDDLTNYVYAITNYYARYQNGSITTTGALGFTSSPGFLTNGMDIVGLLSAPEFMDLNGVPSNYLVLNGVGYSNHVIAYVRSISGPAIEKPPQDNDIVQQGSFSYRVLCVNATPAPDTNLYNTALYPNGPPIYNRQLNANLHELRLSFFWPQEPNGNVGPGRLTFRTQVAGQLATNIINGTTLHFYQPQSFVTAP